MRFIAGFDIGSSAVKGALVDRDGNLHRPCTVPYPASATHGSEQDPLAWWNAFVDVLRYWWAGGIDAGSIACLSLCGQMQALIATDAAGEPVHPAILHSDARAGAQAEAIRTLLGGEAIWRTTRNPFNATSVLPKLVHWREHEPLAAARTGRVFVGAKDWLVWRLTGIAVTDPTTAATTGAFDIEQAGWRCDWLDRLGIPRGWLPRIAPSSGTVGGVLPAVMGATGLRAGCPVVCGVGDAAATTLGAGVVDASQCYAYIGTSAWVARVSSDFNPPGAPLFVLPYLSPATAAATGPARDSSAASGPETGISTPAVSAANRFAPHPEPEPGSRGAIGPERRILIGPISNAGGVHRWALELLDAPPAARLAERYAAFERAVAAAPPDPGLLFLPHLAAERFPSSRRRAAPVSPVFRPARRAAS